MERIDIPKRGLTFYKAAMLGLAGASYGALMKVAEIADRDLALTLAFHAFAAAIPLLIALAISTDVEQDARNRHMSSAGLTVVLLLNLGNWAFVIGLAAFLWHYSPSVATTFVVAAGAALAAFIVHGNDLADANRPRDDES